MTTTAATETRMTAAEAKNAALVEDIEFLLDHDAGEARILEALGTPSKEALKRRLMRLARHDLIPRIFEADQIYHQRCQTTGIPPASPRKART